MEAALLTTESGGIMQKKVIIDISDKSGKGTLYNKIEKKVYKIGSMEYQVWKMIEDGESKSAIEVACSFYTSSEIDNLIKLFKDKNLLNGPQNGSKIKNKWNEIKFGIIYPNNSLQKNINIIKIISRITNIFCIPCIFEIIFLLIKDFETIKQIFISSNYYYVGILSVLLMIVSLIIHELFHALEAIRWGGKVPELGLKIYYGFPVAYTTICDLPARDKKGQILTMLAGMKANCIIIGVCMFFLVRVNPSMQIFLSCIILSNVFPILGNLNIYYKFDLYFVTSILLDEKNLMDKTKKNNLSESSKYPVYKFIVKIGEIVLIIGFFIGLIVEILHV